MRRLGFTLIEVLVSLVVFGIVMSALLVARSNLWSDQTVAAGLSQSQIGAKAMVFKLAEAFRDATMCTSTDTGCIVGAGIQNASSNSCTIYSRSSSGALVQTVYSVDSNGNFNVASGGNTATLTSGATLAITYYTSTTYNTTALTTFTPSPSSETDLIAVQITATVALGGATDTYTTFVRLNNGPGTGP